MHILYIILENVLSEWQKEILKGFLIYNLEIYRVKYLSFDTRIIEFGP